MNGDDKKLASELFDMWRIQHNETAKEVRDDVKDIKEKVSNLPCTVHKERMNYIKVSVLGLYTIVGWIIYTLIRKHIG